MTDRYRVRNIDELRTVREDRLAGKTDEDIENRLAAVHGDFSDGALMEQYRQFLSEQGYGDVEPSMISRSLNRGRMLQGSRNVARQDSKLSEKARYLADQLEAEARAAENEET